MIIIDDFLAEDEFKHEMTADRNWQSSLSYHWFEGQAKEEDSHWIKFCNYVWNYTHIPQFDYAGFEYWTNLMSAERRPVLDWHYDHDEHLYDTTGKMLTTNLGLVYYCHNKMPKGGYLEIDRGNDELERIQPVPNRLIIFDPSIPHRVAPITEGERRTLACNIWMKKPSEENFV
jgi:hypothetical protein